MFFLLPILFLFPHIYIFLHSLYSLLILSPPFIFPITPPYYCPFHILSLPHIPSLSSYSLSIFPPISPPFIFSLSLLPLLFSPFPVLLLFCSTAQRPLPFSTDFLSFVALEKILDEPLLYFYPRDKTFGLVQPMPHPASFLCQHRICFRTWNDSLLSPAQIC